MTTIRVLPEAEHELTEAAGWYESKRRGLGVELVALIDRAIGEIAEAPQSYPLWRADRPYRMLVVRRFPYVIFFRVEGAIVDVVAIAHAKRGPGYWSTRP